MKPPTTAVATATEEVCVPCQEAEESSSDVGPATMHRHRIHQADPNPSQHNATQLSTAATFGPFSPPKEESLRPAIMIEYCDRCRWAPRASWTQTELFLTFPTPTLKSIQLIPLNAPDTGGRFRVWCDPGTAPLETGEGRWQILWDRKSEGGFPELKVLKQRIRDVIQPDQKLGHSDAPAHAAQTTTDV